MRDIVAKDETKVEVLDSFVPKGNTKYNGELVKLVYKEMYTTMYWVEYYLHSENFFTLFFARRYFNRLKRKYGGDKK